MAQKIDPASVSSLTLAYVGDSVYELAVRTYALQEHNTNPNEVNKAAKELSRATRQAVMAELLSDEFTEQEMHIFKRGRNAKSVSAPHTCTISEYRRATGLEALLGYLYLDGNEARVWELVTLGIRLLKESEKAGKGDGNE